MLAGGCSRLSCDMAKRGTPACVPGAPEKGGCPANDVCGSVGLWVFCGG